MDRIRNILFFGLIAGAFLFLSKNLKGFLQDDAFIFARYAHNLVQGDGFVYNPGERVEGATSFLWTLMGAFGALFTNNLPVFFQGMNLFFSVLWLGVFALFCRHWLREGITWIWPVILMAMYPSFWLWSYGGLETTFFGFLMYSGFFLASEWAGRGGRWRLGFLSITTLMLILTRPEGLPVSLFILAYTIFLPAEGKRREALVWVGSATLAAFVFLLLFRYFYFGDWAPNTYYAKGGGGYYLKRYGLGRLNAFFRDYFNFLPVFFGLLGFLIKSRLRYWLLIIPGWCFYFVWVGGDILPENRLMLPMVPMMLLGSVAFFDFWGNAFRRFLLNPAFLSIAFGVFLSVSYYLYYRKTLVAYTGVRDALETAHIAAGKYLQENMKSGEKALLTDAGATAYYAPDRYFIDWLGLCDRTVAKAFYHSGYNPWAMSYCYDETEHALRKAHLLAELDRYFRAVKPDYLVLNVYTPSDQDFQNNMWDFQSDLPESLPEFVTRQISFDGYFGILDSEDKGQKWKPVFAAPYSTEFWMVVVKTKPLGVEGL